MKFGGNTVQSGKATIGVLWKKTKQQQKSLGQSCVRHIEVPITIYNTNQFLSHVTLAWPFPVLALFHPPLACGQDAIPQGHHKRGEA